MDEAMVRPLIERVAMEARQRVANDPTGQLGISTAVRQVMRDLGLEKREDWFEFVRREALQGAVLYQITCVVPDGQDADRRIDSIGGGGWRLTLDQAIEGIEAGRWSFIVNVGGYADTVIVASRNGRKYLKTRGDGVEPNNLLDLPRCL